VARTRKANAQRAARAQFSPSQRQLGKGITARQQPLLLPVSSNCTRQACRVPLELLIHPPQPSPKEDCAAQQRNIRCCKSIMIAHGDHIVITSISSCPPQPLPGEDGSHGGKASARAVALRSCEASRSHAFRASPSSHDSRASAAADVMQSREASTQRSCEASTSRAFRASLSSSDSSASAGADVLQSREASTRVRAAHA